jgi:site-specific DNA-methyltransferase (adenine-specific)
MKGDEDTMSDVNHDALSAILGSEVVGRYKFGRGQIGSLGDAQRYFDALAVTEPPAILQGGEEVDIEQVVKAFHAVRNARGDRGSPDQYVADPERNALFLTKCREMGIQASDCARNKGLLRARKLNLLRGVVSVRISFNSEDYAFASELAATELKYKTGASIDDILCDPRLASQFDSIAGSLAPGYSPLHYRWAILRIRKAGRKVRWRAEYKMPELVGRFLLAKDPLEDMPDARGVYLLYEDGKQKPLYARSTEHLRHAVEIHRSPRLMSAVLDKFCQPNLDNFIVSYAVLPAKELLWPVEKKVIDEKKPLFNVPRAA